MEFRENGYSLCTVVYYKKLEKFQKCVMSWINSKPHENFEINIACNGLEKNLLEFLNSLELKYNFVNVFYFSENVGAAKGLNTAFLASKYKYIIKLDDDVLIPKVNQDWLFKLEKCFCSNENVDIVTGVALAAVPTLPYVFRKLNLNERFRETQKVSIEEIGFHYRNPNIINFNEIILKDIEEHAVLLRNNNDGYLEFKVSEEFPFRVMGCLVFTSYEVLKNFGILKENFGLHGQDDIEFDRRLLSMGRGSLTDTSLYYFHWV